MHIAAAITLLILECIPYLFSADMEWIMTVSMLNLQGVILLLLVLNPPKKSNIIARSLILTFLIYRAIDYLLNSVYLFYDYNIYLNSYITTLCICLVIFIYNLFKPYRFKSDVIAENSPNNIYLCFWTPSKGWNLLPSLLGFPFGGMCIYSQGILYGFEWSKSTYQIRPVNKEIIKDKFTVCDTKILMNDIIFSKLQNLKNAKAGRYRIRCIGIIAPVLNLMGSKYRVKGILDRIPSIKAAEILSR